MPEPEDPEEVLEDQARSPVNRTLRIVSESAFGLLVVLAGLVVVAWGGLLADESLVGGAVLVLFGLLVAAVGGWVVRG